MSVAGKVIRGTAFITAGELVNQACSLVRNIILARVLTKDDFGTAALLGLGVSIFEIGGRLSIEGCIVQSRFGAEPRFIASAHLLQFGFGVMSSVMIFVAAHPLAAFFGVAEAAWALQVLAVLPSLRSLIHLDVYRMQREMRFGRSVLIELLPNLLITLAVWPLAERWQSYSVLVWLLLGKQVATTLASHVVAEREYRWAWTLAHIRSILSFGWPMLINGFLLFGIMQGDRFAVGLKHSVAELGVYSIAGSLALLPAALLMKLGNALLLPVFSAARDDSGVFSARFAAAAEILSLLSAVYAVAMIVAGEPSVRMLFGERYAAAGALAGWLGAAQAVRLLRCVPTNAAMSKGDSRNLMNSNVFRLSGLALAFPVAAAGASLTSIAACALVGEVVALIGSLRMYTGAYGIAPQIIFPSAALAFAAISVAAALSWAGIPGLAPAVPLGVTAALVGVLVAVHFVAFRRSRDLVMRKVLPALRVKLVGDR